MKQSQTLKINRNRLRSDRGLASVEIVPLMFIFILLLSYTLGAFGIIHTGIKNSIAARTYAFETFTNRANLVYFRDTAGTEFLHTKTIGNRVHGIASEVPNVDAQFTATERPIRIGIAMEPDGSRNVSSIHNERVHTITPGRRNNQVEVTPTWVMVQYGMCLNNTCGD